MWRDQNDVNAPNDRSIRLIHARIKKETRFIHPRTLASISWIVFFEEICTPGGFAPLRKKLSERHGAIFRALKTPRASSRPLKTRSERIHARRRCQTMRKRDDNIGYKDDTLHILTVLTKICMFGCKANLFVERRRGCVNSHFCNFVLRRKKRERAVSRVA